MQFYKGKSYRTFGPVGPYLCLLEPRIFRVIKESPAELTVNGSVRQNDSTANLVFGPAETLTELSGVQDLRRWRPDRHRHARRLCAERPLARPSKASRRFCPKRPNGSLFLNVQAKRPQYLKIGDVVEARISPAVGRHRSWRSAQRRRGESAHETRRDLRRCPAIEAHGWPTTLPSEHL